MTENDLHSWRKTSDYWTKLVNIYSAKLKAGPKARLYLPLADALVKLGRQNEAVVILEDALLAFPGDRVLKVMLARLKFVSGDSASAKKILESVVANNPDVTSAVSLLCEIYESEGLYDSAEKIAMGLLDYYPDAPQVKTLHGKYRELVASAILDNENDEEIVAAIDIIEVATIDAGDEKGCVVVEACINNVAVNKLEVMLTRISTMKKREQPTLWPQEKY